MIRDGVQYTSPILVPRQRSNVLYGSMRSIQTFIAMPELGDGYEIHGPFPSMEALTFYAAGWDAYANDSGWQSVRLRDPHAAPTIVAPKGELWLGDSYGGHSASEYEGWATATVEPADQEFGRPVS